MRGALRRVFGAFAAVFLLFSHAVPAVAQAAGDMPTLLAVSVDAGRIVLDFDRPVPLTLRHLARPSRLVIELPETVFAVDQAKVPLPDTMTSMRVGRFQPGRSRMVFTFSAPLLASLASAAPEARHEITLVPSGEAEHEARVAADLDGQAVATGQGGEPDAAAPAAGEPFTLVIDPGHGGIDGGAEGRLGTIEKDVTLALGLKLRDALAGTPGLRVVMTRETDVFVALRDRVAAARTNHADLLLSIHGDTIAVPALRGATVYTLSDSASDSIARALAEQENLSDEIAGVPQAQADPSVNSILVDLLKRETETFSKTLARELVVHLEKGEIQLIKNPLRSAGFRVLTAPDVPSLLLELGYLSNAEDELLMRDDAWRTRIVAVIADAVKAYAGNHKVNNAAP